jgi:hypothetical protein
MTASPPESVRIRGAAASIAAEHPSQGKDMGVIVAMWCSSSSGKGRAAGSAAICGADGEAYLSANDFNFHNTQQGNLLVVKDFREPSASGSLQGAMGAWYHAVQLFGDVLVGRKIIVPENLEKADIFIVASACTTRPRIS